MYWYEKKPLIYWYEKKSLRYWYEKKSYIYRYKKNEKKSLIYRYKKMRKIIFNDNSSFLLFFLLVVYNQRATKRGTISWSSWNKQRHCCSRIQSWKPSCSTKGRPSSWTNKWDTCCSSWGKQGGASWRTKDWPSCYRFKRWDSTCWTKARN